MSARQEKLTPEIAAAVWDMLGEVCIGDGNWHANWRQQFIQDATGRGIDEWRFSGRLGYGGKIYSNPWRVSCYPEDRTPEREAMIAEANRRLKEIIGDGITVESFPIDSGIQKEIMKRLGGKSEGGAG